MSSVVPFVSSSSSSPSQTQQPTEELGVVLKSLGIKTTMIDLPFFASDELDLSASELLNGGGGSGTIAGTTKNGTEFERLLLEKNDSRYVLFPIKCPLIWEKYKEHQSYLWTAEEINLQTDVIHWNTMLNSDERHFLSMVLAFFAASDGIVLENLAVRFMAEVQLPEALQYYQTQIYMEGVHSETYSVLIDTLIQNPVEKAKLFNVLTDKSRPEYECIRKKAAWAKRWIDDNRSCFSTRLVAFACVEGIFFSGAFCSIYWLKEREGGIMPGLCYSNELISRDEGKHCEFAVLLFRLIGRQIDAARIHSIIREAVAIETEFICEALPCRLINMNADAMTQYIQFCADRLSKQLGYSQIYGVTCPFAFMDRISLKSRTNFFDRKNDSYGLACRESMNDGLFAEEGEEVEY